MSVLVNQSQAIQSNANEFRLCAFLDLVSKSKLEGYIVMEGTFRLCAFLLCESQIEILRNENHDLANARSSSSRADPGLRVAFKCLNI